MTERTLSNMTDAALSLILRYRESEHAMNVTTLERVRECCERSGEALRDVQAEIERRKGNE